MKTRATILLSLIFAAPGMFAQSLPEKGMPKLENFTPTQYQNKGKIWDIHSAPNGIVYIASDKGLLEYDGKSWNSYKGSNGSVRSLTIKSDSLIYTGSDLDFGVWKRNNYQAFEYSSLYPFQKDIQDINEEFWDVYQQKDNIIFVSSQNIYVYKNLQLTKIAAPNKFSGSFAVDDSLYFTDEKNGLYIFNELSLKQLFEYPEGINFQISGIYHHPKGLVIVTKNLGLYLFSSGNLSTFNDAFSQKLQLDKVFSFEQIDPQHVAYGTVLNGLYITNLDGDIIHYINKQKGLANNTILCLHFTPAGKLWLGLDYGLSALDLKSNLTYFYDYRGDFGTGSAALLKEGTFYLGTNQGLYKSAWDNLDNDSYYSFRLISGTEGQVWTLKNIDGNILIGHDLGLFILRGNTIQKLSNEHGVWTILPYKDYLLTGNYNGISIFKKSTNSWNFLKKMDLILGSCNQLIVEKEDILWVNIPNYGIIRAVLDSSLHPAERLIFPEDSFEGNSPYLQKDKDEILVVTDKYQYSYNPEDKKFIKKAGAYIYPKVENLLSGIYQPVPLQTDYEFFPVYNGFALKYIRNEEKKDTGNYTLVLRKIEAFNNEQRRLFYPGAMIPHSLNNVKIEYTVPNQENVSYQYKLSATDKWSPPVPKNSFELLNIKDGEHTLFARAFIDGEISSTAGLTFHIASPWYRTWYAYVFYLIILALGGYFIRRWQIISLKKQKKELLIREKNSLRNQAEKFKQEIMLLEQERMKIEYNQLKQQLRSKTIDLANKAKENEDKNRLLLSLKEKCEQNLNNPEKSSTVCREMQRLIDSYLKLEDKTFEIQMDELHQEFFKKLKEQFPGLSNNDLRLCAYIKIGLKSKEIADILNIQPSSAYISRSRLRKKLNLEFDEDLYNFLISL